MSMSPSDRPALHSPVAQALVDAAHALKLAADALAQAGLAMEEDALGDYWKSRTENERIAEAPVAEHTPGPLSKPGGGSTMASEMADLVSAVRATAPQEKRHMRDWTDQELMDAHIQPDPSPTGVPLLPAGPRDALVMPVGPMRGVPIVDHRVLLGHVLSFLNWAHTEVPGLGMPVTAYHDEVALATSKIYEKGNLATEDALKKTYRWAIKEPDRKARLRPWLLVVWDVIRQRKILASPDIAP